MSTILNSLIPRKLLVCITHYFVYVSIYLHDCELKRFFLEKITKRDRSGVSRVIFKKIMSICIFRVLVSALVQNTTILYVCNSQYNQSKQMMEGIHYFSIHLHIVMFWSAVECISCSNSRCKIYCMPSFQRY